MSYREKLFLQLWTSGGFGLEETRCRFVDGSMSVSVCWRIGGALLLIVACGAVLAQEPDFVLGGDLNGLRNAPKVRRITFGSNLFVEPCSSCNYNSNAPSWFVLGPDNCFVPGTTQWIAVPFIAAATGVPKQ